MKGVHAPDRTYLGQARHVGPPGSREGRWEGELDDAFASDLTQRHFEAGTYEDLRKLMIDHVGDDPGQQAEQHREAKYGVPEDRGR